MRCKMVSVGCESFVPVCFCKEKGGGISAKIVLKMQELWNEFWVFLDNLIKNGFYARWNNLQK